MIAHPTTVSSLKDVHTATMNLCKVRHGISDGLRDVIGQSSRI